MNNKALIAMSGGVDSSVAALLTIKQGYDCIGVTMKLFNNEDIGEESEKSCCSLSDIEDARSVAYRLGMPYYVFNFTGDFKKYVIDKFVRCYECGATPNPCIDCNRHLKFDKLFSRARELGRDYVVTGHYARIEFDGASGRYLLKKAVDDSKDQSYVLYSMTQEQLKHTLFPLGGLHKSEVRDIAEENGFINANKHDSQDICFVKDNDYAKFIEEYTGNKYPQGDFIDLEGNVIGKHRGIIRYTIGQRKGLGISSDAPLYVCSKNIENNTVVLGSDRDLYSKTVTASNINLIAADKIDSPIRLKARIRYKQQEEWVTAEQTEDDRMIITFDSPQRAPAAGQAVVLYDGDVVFGGGVIE